jgi:hypothetical protein
MIGDFQNAGNFPSGTCEEIDAAEGVALCRLRA